MAAPDQRLTAQCLDYIAGRHPEGANYRRCAGVVYLADRISLGNYDYRFTSGDFEMTLDGPAASQVLATMRAHQADPDTILHSRAITGRTDPFVLENFDELSDASLDCLEAACQLSVSKTDQQLCQFLWALPEAAGANSTPAPLSTARILAGLGRSAHEVEAVLRQISELNGIDAVFKQLAAAAPRRN